MTCIFTLISASFALCQSSSAFLLTSYPRSSPYVEPLPYTQPQQPSNQLQPGYTAQPGPPQPGYPAHPDQQPQTGYLPQYGYPPPQQPGYPLQPFQQVQPSTSMVTVGMSATQTVILSANPRPQNWLGFSIFTCLFCVWPIGLAAIVFSCMVDSSYDARDYEGALRNANIAKWLNLVSILCGIILIVVVFVIMTT